MTFAAANLAIGRAFKSLQQQQQQQASDAESKEQKSAAVAMDLDDASSSSGRAPRIEDRIVEAKRAKQEQLDERQRTSEGLRQHSAPLSPEQLEAITISMQVRPRCLLSAVRCVP